MTRQIALDTTGARGPRLLLLASQAQQEAAYWYSKFCDYRNKGYNDAAANAHFLAAMHYRDARIFMSIE